MHYHASLLSLSRLILSLLILSLLILGCSRSDTIVVGAKAFSEGYLLGQMAVLMLENEGYAVEEQFGLASSAMRSALESGQVDLYYEYTGTAYTVYAKGTDVSVMSDSARVLAAVRSFDSTTHHLQWLQPIPFDNTYALLMRKSDATRLGITSLSNLAETLRNGRTLAIAVDGEFYERADGWKALAARYGLDDKGIIKMDAGLIYQGLRDGQVAVGMGYSTDGRIPGFDLVVLRDDRGFFPAYNPAAVVREETLRAFPKARAALERLNRVLDTPNIQRLNALVDIEHRDPRKVAREFLLSKGLIRPSL